MDERAQLALAAGWCLLIAWRYGRLPVSQDEGLWMLWGTTGSRPYLDHVDCKPPGIHLWSWLLAKLTGRRPRLCRLLHQLALAAVGWSAFRVSGQIEVALAFFLLTQSAHFEGYYAWVETAAAACWLPAFFVGAWPATALLGLAVLFDAKLALPLLLFALLRGFYLETAVLVAVAAGLALLLRLAAPRLFAALWYSCVTVPRRMVAQRRKDGQRVVPAWQKSLTTPLLILLPAAAAAIAARPEAAWWLPALAYVAINAGGRVFRPYHWIPLAAPIAAAAPSLVWTLTIADLVSNGFYGGDFIARIRGPAVSRGLETADKIGRELAASPGRRLWVDGEFTQIYVIAHAAPALLPVEQVEIRRVIPERRGPETGTVARVDTVVICPGETQIVPDGFRIRRREGQFLVLERLLA